MASLPINDIMEKYLQNDLVTWAECQKIFENIMEDEEFKGTLHSFDIIPELGCIGYLGEYFHLTLKYVKENETELTSRRLFVKTKPYHNAEMADYMQRSGMLQKEATLYSTLLAEISRYSDNIWCAKCYLVKPDLFIMQNIQELGYEPLQNADRFLNLDEIKTILKGLATMHACSLAYESEHEITIGEQFEGALFEVTVSPKVVWYTAGRKAVEAIALKNPLYQSEPLYFFIKNQLPKILDTVYELLQPSEKYCNVLCHRDIWGGNVFFDKENPYEKGTVFVDFQLARYLPPAIDVVMTLYLNMRPADRKLIEEECCEYYFEQFSKELTDMDLNPDDFINYEDFLLSFKEYCLFGALYNCVAATVLRTPGDFLKNMTLHHPQDFHHYTNVDRTKEVMELMEKDKEYGQHVVECIEDMMAFIWKENYVA